MTQIEHRLLIHLNQRPEVTILWSHDTSRMPPDVQLEHDIRADIADLQKVIRQIEQINAHLGSQKYQTRVDMAKLLINQIR